VNWAQFAVESNAKTPTFKPHPRWCALHLEDKVSNSLKVEGVYDNMLVVDNRYDLRFLSGVEVHSTVYFISMRLSPYPAAGTSSVLWRH
jgi:hypothetical protein